jgi:hypothetical protein
MSIIEVLNGQYDWGIDTLVGQLRELRLQSLETRSRRNTPPQTTFKKRITGYFGWTRRRFVSKQVRASRSE